MKGIVRKIEGLGRMVIPKAIREHMNITSNDSIEFIVTGNDEVIIRRFQKSCVFCGNKENLSDFSDKCICDSCVEKIKNIK